MDFTREPIVETVVTPRDGYKIVVRSSKNHTQEEFVVDALEVVSFGNNCFFRSLERPKVFIVPAMDYEILEMREPRLALKAAPLEGVIRTPMAKDLPKASVREPERREVIPPLKEQFVEPEPISSESLIEEAEAPVPAVEQRPERRKDKKKNLRRRRGGRDESSEESSGEVKSSAETKHEDRVVPSTDTSSVQPLSSQKEVVSAPMVTSILPPPATLIRDDLKRLRGSDEYKGAFYLKEEESVSVDEGDDDAPVVPLSLRGDDELPRRVEEVPEIVQQEENTYKATPAPLEEEPFWGVRPVRVPPSEPVASSESSTPSV